MIEIGIDQHLHQIRERAKEAKGGRKKIKGAKGQVGFYDYEAGVQGEERVLSPRENVRNSIFPQLFPSPPLNFPHHTLATPLGPISWVIPGHFFCSDHRQDNLIRVFMARPEKKR